jgi:outer membrane protein OmpA-like peptidoglycan-associated protein
MSRLDQIIGDIGNEKCRVQITGYSSTQGDHATNALFAVERAQNVLRYLKENGMTFASVNATGAGATEKFGAEFSANRRVVITVTP